MRKSRRISQISASLLVVAALVACGDKQGAAPAGGMPPTEVGVVTVTPGPLAVTNELPGRLEGTRTAEVRARVEGIVKERVYREGSDVKAGAVLFRIDPAPFQAQLASAQAALARAQATAAASRQKAERYGPLVGVNAISKQEYDEAVAAARQADAEVAAARAGVTTAQLNLGYATVTAPISGRVGRALVTEGALVGRGEATPLATVEQVDPMRVTFTQPADEVFKLKQAVEAGQLKGVSGKEAAVTLLRGDGSEYPHPGKLLFSDMAVDPTSGAITLRAEFPNPKRELLSGVFVRVRVNQAVNEHGITVPQRALIRSGQGASVMIVGADGNVASVPVQVGVARGDQWVINGGLKGGEQVIVEGLQKVKPGAPAKAVPFVPAGAQPASAPAAAPASAPAAEPASQAASQAQG
ncbi:MAG TPA: efflux RND transporter periplasmic adaptor subunit [Burkholderiaceae bacterium]|nr:efflux RND transporter periplasmic adaptor subunit [Burkholderiaceae bacterium]